MKTPQYYFSRNFVEFGTFSPTEIIDFRKRGILTDHDYVRAVDSDNWELVSQWSVADAVVAKPVKAKAPSTRKKAATVTKSSKKVA